MTKPDRLTGVLAPVLTPFGRDLAPDLRKLVAHCQCLLDGGLKLAPFGTTSEANSLSLAEKQSLLAALDEAGIDAAHMLPGTGCCALPDTVALTRQAVSMGCAGVLLLPPFYYKAVSDDGLFDTVAHLIETVADSRLRIYLYHIPPIAQVGWSHDLIERLVVAWPDQVVGIKDSSGDWANTAAMHDRKWDDFRIFVGTERYLLANLRTGGAGCISATANINPAGLQAVLNQWREPAAEQLNAQALAIRDLFERYPMIAALKAALSHRRDDPDWQMVRPPLTVLDAARRRELVSGLADCGLDGAVA